MEPAANTEALDQQFKEFIQGIKKAVGAGIPHLKDDPKIETHSVEVEGTDKKAILLRPRH